MLLMIDCLVEHWIYVEILVPFVHGKMIFFDWFGMVSSHPHQVDVYVAKLILDIHTCVDLVLFQILHVLLLCKKKMNIS